MFSVGHVWSILATNFCAVCESSQILLKLAFGSLVSRELEELGVVDSVWLKRQHEVTIAVFTKNLKGIFDKGLALHADHLDGVT